jgi:galactonate dehydratase
MSDSFASRRALLGTAAAAAGLLLAEGHARGEEPGAAVADRTSTIRIKSLRAIPVGTKAFVKLETNHGLTGWGEITGLVPKVACALAESLFALLDGENPTRIEYLWQKIYRSHRDMRGGPFMTHTLSAIDMALWDITGKLWGVPVFRLLGGPVRDKIRAYPNAKAFKQAAGGPKPFSGTPAEIDGLVERVVETRRRVGPDGIVMFDAHCCVPPPMLIQFAAAIKPYDVFWIEEPAVPGNIEVFKRLKEQISIPLATGERDRTIWEVLPYLEHRAIDILQPDCGHCGGISQMRKIATLAEAYQTPLAPHCTMSFLGLSASLQASAAVPLFLIHETYTDGHIMPEGVVRKTWEQDKEGNVLLTDAPGLGIEVDEAKAAEVNADPKRQYKWPLQTLKDGTIADY